jgi:hypothetical protein
MGRLAIWAGLSGQSLFLLVLAVLVGLVGWQAWSDRLFPRGAAAPSRRNGRRGMVFTLRSATIGLMLIGFALGLSGPGLSATFTSSGLVSQALRVGQFATETPTESATPSPTASALVPTDNSTGKSLLHTKLAPTLTPSATDSTTPTVKTGTAAALTPTTVESATPSARNGSQASATPEQTDNTLPAATVTSTASATCLEGLAVVAMCEGEMGWAARLGGAAFAQHASSVWPSAAALPASAEDALGVLRRHLGEEAFDQAWSEGTLLSLERTMRLAAAPS